MVEELDQDPLFADDGANVPEFTEAPIEQAEEAPATEQSEPEPEPQPEPVAQPDRPEPGYVPIAVVMDERDKRKAAEAERDRLRAAQPTTQAPNPFDDPDGYAAHQQQLVEGRLWSHTVLISAQFAERQYGKEETEAAMKWADARIASDPIFQAQVRQQVSPVEWIVQQHKRDALLSDIGDNPDDWFTREATKRGYAPLSATVAAADAQVPVVTPTPAVPPVKVPRSLATQGSSPSDIRDVATGPLAAVDSVFPQ